MFKNKFSKLLFNLILFLSFFANSQVLFAEQKNSQAYLKDQELIEYKLKIEENISKSYKTRIQTQLSPDSFSVNIQVDLKKVKNLKNSLTAKDNKINHPSLENRDSLPKDLTLGLIDAQKMLENYEHELQNLKNESSKNFNSDSSNEIDEQILITQVRVEVGLDPSLGDDYQKEFETWLKTSVQNEFGKEASVKITKIQKIADKKTEDKKTTLFEKINSVQMIIASLFLVIGLFFLLIFSKFIASKDVKEQIKMQMQVLEQQSNQNKLSDSNILSSARAKEENFENQEVVFKSIEDLNRKILNLSFAKMNESKNVFNLIFEVWFEAGLEGRLKTVCLLDVLLGHHFDKPIDFMMPEAIKKDALMAKAFKAVSEFDIHKKQKLLDQVYWDVLSYKSVGVKALQTQFSAALALPTENLNKILKNQDAKLKSLVLLHLPTEKIQNYIADMELTERKKIFADALNLKKVDTLELQSLDDQFKLMVKSEALGQAETMFTSNSFLPNLLEAFTAQEQLAWLRELAPKMQDQGLFLKHNLMTLAFLDEWKEEFLKAWVLASQTQDLTHLVFVMPEVKDIVLKYCPPRTQSIISDDLKLLQSVPEDQIQFSLIRLRNTMMKQVSLKGLNLKNIYQKNSNNSLKSVA